MATTTRTSHRATQSLLTVVAMATTSHRATQTSLLTVVAMKLHPPLGCELMFGLHTHTWTEEGGRDQGRKRSREGRREGIERGGRGPGRGRKGEMEGQESGREEDPCTDTTLKNFT